MPHPSTYSCIIIILVSQKVDVVEGEFPLNSGEEWRTKRNVRDRIYEQTLPKLFPDSNRYAYRMPVCKYLDA